MNDVQCYELFGGIALKNHAFSSVKHNCHYNHIQSIHSDAFKYQFLPEVSDLGISILTI